MTVAKSLLTVGFQTNILVTLLKRKDNLSIKCMMTMTIVLMPKEIMELFIDLKAWALVVSTTSGQSASYQTVPSYLY